MIAVILFLLFEIIIVSALAYIIFEWKDDEITPIDKMHHDDTWYSTDTDISTFSLDW